MLPDRDQTRATLRAEIDELESRLVVEEEGAVRRVDEGPAFNAARARVIECRQRLEAMRGILAAVDRVETQEREAEAKERAAYAALMKSLRTDKMPANELLERGTSTLARLSSKYPISGVRCSGKELGEHLLMRDVELPELDIAVIRATANTKHDIPIGARVAAQRFLEGYE